MNQTNVIAATRNWIRSVVVALDLCPFAQRVFDAETIRFVVSAACDQTALLADLASEINALVAAPISQIETTILIHPLVLGDFLAYNDFLDPAESLIQELGQRGVIQLASFHPDYRFAGSRADAVENYTNRSPYPMLHLLREESITAVAADPDALEQIPKRNAATLRRLGRNKIQEILEATRGEADSGG